MITWTPCTNSGGFIVANKLAERLANRQGVRIDAPDPAPPGDDPPETHRDKLAAGW